LAVSHGGGGFAKPMRGIEKDALAGQKGESSFKQVWGRGKKNHETARKAVRGNKRKGVTTSKIKREKNS